MVTKTLLLSGATGFLGSHLANRWAAKGHCVLALKRRGSSLSRLSMSEQMKYFNVEDGFDDLFKYAGKVDAVIHTACSYGRGGETPAEVFAINSAFALTLLQSSVDYGVPVFINTASALNKYLNPYSLSKSQFSEWGQWFAGADRIRFVDVKLEHMYGAGDDSSKFTTHVIKSFLQNVPQLKLTAGEQKRDFVYIDDVVDAYDLLIEKAADFTSTYRDFALGSSQAVTIRQFVELARILTQSTTEPLFGALPYRMGEVMESEAVVKDLIDLGWRSMYGLEQGLNKTIEQERNNL